MNEPDLSAMDPQARRFLAMVAVGAAASAGYASIEDRRRSFDQLMRFSRPPSDLVESYDLEMPRNSGTTIQVRVYTPRSITSRTGLVYFHGGGLVAGSIASHDAICRAVSLDAGCRVLSVNYRLAPEYPFPAGIIDALHAVRWVSRNKSKLDLEGIAVGGDSGGATLAAITCQTMRQHVDIKAQVLLCPVLDFAGAHSSRAAFAEGFLLDAATMARDLELYAPTRGHADPRISPLQELSLADMPRTLIHTAGFDPLRDEGFAYAMRLREAGVRVDHTCHAGLIHHFYGLTAAIPAARTALAAIGTDLKRVLA